MRFAAGGLFARFTRRPDALQLAFCLFHAVLCNGRVHRYYPHIFSFWPVGQAKRYRIKRVRS
jgi:hypothetical protein